MPVRGGCHETPGKMAYHRIMVIVRGWCMNRPVVTSSSEILGGTPVFPGTRVPVQTLVEYLEAGESIEEFLLGFPSVSRVQVISFLEHAAALAVTEAV